MSQERLSSSEAAHRRQVLAEERRKPSFIEQTIFEKEQAERRFVEVKSLLNSEGTALEELAVQEELSLEQIRVSLEIEQIWLKFRLEHISQAKRQSLLQKKLDKLEREDPDLLEWLTTSDEDDEALLGSIRNRVIPPIRVKGFYTKRRRRR